MLMLHSKIRKLMDKIRDSGRTIMTADEVAYLFEEKYGTKLNDEDMRSLRLYLASHYPKEYATQEVLDKDRDGRPKRRTSKVNIYKIR